MRNLDSWRCWRCTLCPCKVRNKFLFNFWNRTILLCVPCIMYGFLHLLRHSVNASLPLISSHQLEMSLTDRPTLLKLSFCVVVSAYKSDLKCWLVEYRESIVMGCKEMGFVMSGLPVGKKGLLCNAKGCHLWYPVAVVLLMSRCDEELSRFAGPCDMFETV